MISAKEATKRAKACRESPGLISLLNLIDEQISKDIEKAPYKGSLKVDMDFYFDAANIMTADDRNYIINMIMTRIKKAGYRVSEQGSFLFIKWDT